MINQKPVLRWSKTAGYVEGDCACPDTFSTVDVRWAQVQDIGEQDCACPDVGPTATEVWTHSIRSWHLARPLYRVPLPDKHQVVFAPLVPTPIAVLNAPATRVLDAFAQPRPLSYPPDAVSGVAPADISRVVAEMATHGLLRPTGERESPCQALPHTFTAWLHVSDRCNAACTYCYLTQSGEQMDRATGFAAVDALFRSAAAHGFHAVKLKYAGGEPTFNFPLVAALHDRALALSQDYNLVLREVMLSNGLAITDDILHALHSMGTKLAISLDGVGPVHDAQRGSGTFARVAQSIDRAIALGLRPHVSITVTSDSVDGLVDVVGYVLDRDLSFNLNFYREHACGAADAGLAAENGHLIECVRAALALIEARLPQRSIVPGLLDRANLGYAHSHPCGVGQNYAVVDHRGRLARCHMEMDEPVGDVHADDLVDAVRAPVDGWRNLEVDARDGCRSCDWRYWCAGGCPMLTHRVTGSNDAPSPYCDVYRAIFPDLVRLEGLRLLKWEPAVA